MVVWVVLGCWEFVVGGILFSFACDCCSCLVVVGSCRFVAGLFAVLGWLVVALSFVSFVRVMFGYGFACGL